MGFMAGFGSAFSEGVKRNQELREQRKDDIFKMTFNEMSKQNEKRTERIAQDRKDISKAKAFAESVDPKVWPKVYEWVQAGLTDEEISKRMSGFNQPTAQVAEPKAPTAPEGPAGPVGPTPEAPVPPADGPKGQEMVPDMGATGSVPPKVANAAQIATGNAQGSSSSPSDNLATQTQAALPVKAKAGVDDTMVTSQENPEAAQSGTNQFLSGLSGKNFNKAPAAQAAPAPEGRGFSGIMSDAFGNGSGVETRRRYMAEAKDVAGQMFGEQEAEVQVPDTADIRWTPPKPTAEPDKINTLDEAQIELDTATASNDPQRIAIAQRRVNSLIQSGKIKAEQEAEAKGFSTGNTYVNIFGPDATGKRVWKGTVRATKNSDGSYVDAENNPIAPENVQTMDKIEWEQRDKVIRETGKQVGEYRKALSDYTSMVSDVGSLDKTYQENPEALQKWSTTAASIVQDVTNEIKSGVNLLARTAGEEYSAEFAIDTLEKQSVALQARVDGSQTPIEKQANAAALAETQKALITYRLAASLGQDGKNLAETERKMFGQTLTATNYPQFRAKVQAVLESTNKTLEGKAADVNAATSGFKSLTGYVPYEVQIETPQERFINVTPESDPDLYNGITVLKGGPVSAGTDAVDSAAKNLGTDSPNAPTAKPPLEGSAPGKNYWTLAPDKKEIAKQRIRQNPEKGAADFDALYGRGATARLLAGE